MDIAGLVKGASKGEGLGNAFLSHIAAVDGIFHVCRAFEDPDVTHVEDRVDPVGDLDIIHHELRLKDLEKIDAVIDGFKKMKQALKKEQSDELDVAQRIKALLEEGTDIRFGDWSAKDIEVGEGGFWGSGTCSTDAHAHDAFIFIIKQPSRQCQGHQAPAPLWCVSMSYGSMILIN